MVAMKEMLPNDPDDRSAVEDTLREHPRIANFIQRLDNHVRAHFRDAEVSIETLNYDEWDPPIMVVTTATMPSHEYVSQLHHLRQWARDDPDYDEEVIHVSLFPRLAADTAR